MTNEEELEELLNDPVFEISAIERELFTLPEELKVKSSREQADYVAQRKPCVNFNDYAPLFRQVHRDLKEGKRSLMRYSEKAIKEGGFYIVSGIMVYLERILDLKKDRRNHNHIDGRTRVIYENGMESDIKLRTLGKNIQTDGFIISESCAADAGVLEQAFGISTGDRQDGWIYVLRSLSENPGIAGQKDLYKIGFSTQPVEERIRNCEYEPTYLMDKVEVVAAWKAYNMNTHAFETLIHQFFAAAKFHVKVYDLAGNEHEPQEWFIVPLAILKSVIHRIIDGTIVNYSYNVALQVLEEHRTEGNRYKSEKIDTEGWAILSLVVKEGIFRQILYEGQNRVDKELKQSKLNLYTWIENSTGIRYLRKYDALRLYSGYQQDRETALVEVTDTSYNPDHCMISYHLGKILEVDLKEIV